MDSYYRMAVSYFGGIVVPICLEVIVFSRTLVFETGCASQAGQPFIAALRSAGLGVKLIIVLIQVAIVEQFYSKLRCRLWMFAHLTQWLLFVAYLLGRATYRADVSQLPGCESVWVIVLVNMSLWLLDSFCTCILLGYVQSRAKTSPPAWHPFVFDGDTDKGINTECVVCLCEFLKGEQIARLHCGHTFHHQCILSYFSSRQLPCCPLRCEPNRCLDQQQISAVGRPAV
eukprot:TRINITY_DN28598_c0_g1_i1.p1 TRINITY_DN28598_c0_g1~~TRINITY_DN28598_c0_g1_i1.p1  ORF type:complete len:229 (+),score=13.30 TRINITY_DN28598_c0_g1_i1:89-775(+)